MKRLITLSALALLGACASTPAPALPEATSVVTVDGVTVGAFGRGYTFTKDGVAMTYGCDDDESAWQVVDDVGHPMQGMPLCFKTADPDSGTNAAKSFHD
jgi:hypothetical protein